MPSKDDVLKALVDAELARNPHPDTAGVLQEWRDDNTSEDERRAKLTDDERAQEDREHEQEQARNRSRSRSADATNRESEDDGDDGSPSRTAGQKESSTTAPDAAGGSSRKAGK